MEALISAGVGLLGVLLGGGIGIAGTLFLDKRRRDAERRALAGSLAAEVDAILLLEEHHQYRLIYSSALDRIRAGSGEIMPAIIAHRDPAKAVFYANLGRIGILPAPLPARLVTGNILAESITIDRQAMAEGVWDQGQPVDQRCRFLEHHLTTYDKAVALTKELSEELHKEAVR